MPITLEARDRSLIDDKYKWNIDDVYPGVAAWRAEKERIASALSVIGTFAGRLGSSAQVLADALDTSRNLEKELLRLYVYASMLADQDTRAAEPQGMRQEMQLLLADFSVQASYVEPEILRLSTGTIDAFLAAEPRLGIHAFYLRDIIRRAPHTLTDAEEKILANAQPLAASSGNIYGILANADFPYPSVTLDDGKKAKVDQT